MNESVGAPVDVPNEFMKYNSNELPQNKLPTAPEFTGTHKRPDNIFVSASKMPQGTVTPKNELLSRMNSALQDNPLFKQQDSRSSLPSFLKKRGASQDNDSKNSFATTTADNLGQFTGVENRLPSKISVKERINPINATHNVPKNYSLPLVENR